MGEDRFVRQITLNVNGEPRTCAVEHRTTLADHLRHGLGLTGTHIGCEHGVCGACTVLVDGHAVRSCLMLAVQAAGRKITTVEGLSPGSGLNPLQEALWRRHGLQCGFCTPGILMSLTEYLAANEECTEEGVRDVLSGHLCRCTGYQAIVEAALDVAQRRAKAS